MLLISQFYLPHPHLTPSLWGNPSEFQDETCSRKNRGMGLPYGENFIILSSTFFVWSTHLADGQTDRQTGGRTGDSI